MYYWVYGFALKSDFELPELREITREEAEAGPPPMVEIVNGLVPEALPGERRLASWFSHSGSACLYSIPRVARLLVEDGCRVTVDMYSGALESDMRTYLLGSGLGTIAYQRGLIPLHVSSVLAPHGAIAFTGPSGAGKSTAAATLHEDLGWPIISDDVAVLILKKNSVRIEGGVRRLRLWSDALDRLGWSRDGLVRDTHKKEKYLSLCDSNFSHGPHPIMELCEIRPSFERPRIIKGADKLSVIISSIYRPFLVDICDARGALNRSALLALRQITCRRGSRNLINSVGSFGDEMHKSGGVN